MRDYRNKSVCFYYDYGEANVLHSIRDKKKFSDPYLVFQKAKLRVCEQT